MKKMGMDYREEQLVYEMKTELMEKYPAIDDDAIRWTRNGNVISAGHFKRRVLDGAFEDDWVPLVKRTITSGFNWLDDGFYTATEAAFLAEGLETDDAIMMARIFCRIINADTQQGGTQERPLCEEE